MKEYDELVRAITGATGLAGGSYERNAVRRVKAVLKRNGWKTPAEHKFYVAKFTELARKNDALVDGQAGRANSDAQVKRLVLALAAIADPEGSLKGAVAKGPEREELQAAYLAVLGVGELPGKA